MRAKRIIVVILALAAVAVAIITVVRPGSSPKSAGLTARQHAMELLGAQIAQLHPDGKVLVLSNPFTKTAGFLQERSQYERAGLRGLTKGLGRNAQVTVVFPEIRPEYFTDRQSLLIPADSRTPMSFVIQPSSVDALAEAHPACRVIVSLIGLPAGVDKLKIWDEKDPRAFALLLPDLRVIGPPAETVAAFQRGKLLAIVVNDLKTGQPLIVTRDNIADVLQQQPSVFGY